jgi:hypothetical protein
MADSNLDRISSSVVVALCMVGCILFTSQRKGGHLGVLKEGSEFRI